VGGIYAGGVGGGGEIGCARLRWFEGLDFWGRGTGTYGGEDEGLD